MDENYIKFIVVYVELMVKGVDLVVKCKFLF